MRIPGHSPWLPGYIDVVQMVLVILMRLFQDRLIHMCVCVYILETKFFLQDHKTKGDRNPDK